MMFFGGVTGFSMMFGFGYALVMAKKKDPDGFIQGVVGKPGTAGVKVETGSSFALKALGRATLITFTGFGLFCYGIWKMMGVQNAEEFRNKVGTALPRIPKTESKGRTEFENLKDLADYLVDEDTKNAKRET
ncbi:hypothetical protein CAPTEDRAFT_206401 [Capitella teleta]|uniref:Transmembrane protein 242 n=1 Tax=Capitella teleta TaxID=283909 RepID=R7T8M8_CAPTE|nr:hypothetical protein CAPTEDRAFT_206401 [Capitella teleta]|eukprot:ELT90029.1 hypothetical protein CAPTEDRAFT_206401 [Capitella teleta]